MDSGKPASVPPGAGGAGTPVATALAKGALRRLTLARQEPTPENYARAYAEEAGQPAAPASAAQEARAQGVAWSMLTERLAKNLERGGRQWTSARRKDSLQRVFDSSRSDAPRLLKRLQSLLTAWETDTQADPAETGIDDVPGEIGARSPVVLPAVPPAVPPAAPAAAAPQRGGTDDHPRWQQLIVALESAVRAALPADDPRAAELAAQLDVLAREVEHAGAEPSLVARMDGLCQQARRLFGHRHQLVDQLGELSRELGAGLVELAEDDSWVRGQCESLQARLADGVSARSVRAASALLADTRERQRAVRGERQQARDGLKQLIHDMLLQVGELGDHTGRFQQATAQHADAITQAESLEGLADVVKAMVADARAVQSAVGQSQQRLQADHNRGLALESKVRELESELQRLSEEVSTDALTQVANRRGLSQAFEAETARSRRAVGGATTLSVALIDIDNFKRLNDKLGHAAGDRALQALSAAVRERLRPADHLARFGGEEFVVLLPVTETDEAQRVLTRLQRSLSEALFLHEGREVFVTFSAGVTAWREGEALQASLERADEALYEAKRAGKNRTCIG